MYKTLLVDDEPMITKGLAHLIDWEDEGFEIVGTAGSAEEALQYIERNAIDLLLTDIVMLEMSGLELIKKAKEYLPNLKVIVLSGYQDFAYVKQGLHLGIENYLLKPIDEEELLQTIKGIAMKLADTTEQPVKMDEVILKENVLQRLLDGEISIQHVKERLALYDSMIVGDSFAVAMMNIEHRYEAGLIQLLQRQIERDYPITCFFNSDRDLMMICTGDEQQIVDYMSTIMMVIETTYPQLGKCYLTLGSHVTELDLLVDSFAVAKRLSILQLFLPIQSIITQQSFKQHQEKLKCEQQLKQQLAKQLSNEQNNIQKVVADFWEQLTVNSVFLPPSITRHFAIDLLSFIHYTIKPDDLVRQTIFIEKIVHQNEVQAIKETLLHFCQDLVQSITSEKNTRSPIVNQMLDFIHENYAQELSLKFLGDRFHVNAIYLGQLFQKEIGMVFSSYINQYRLKKAKELLKTTYLKAGEISKMVGYADTTYFYKLFKRHFGVTPTKWRNL